MMSSEVSQSSKFVFDFNRDSTRFNRTAMIIGPRLNDLKTQNLNWAKFESSFGRKWSQTWVEQSCKLQIGTWFHYFINFENLLLQHLRYELESGIYQILEKPRRDRVVNSGPRLFKFSFYWTRNKKLFDFIFRACIPISKNSWDFSDSKILLKRIYIPGIF